ncbi:MAG: hypothetical protein K2I89_09755, partial [Muribaculaceae bacterium]|nr:hypothetical protein [Muribaculaceae bacterium]
SPPLGKTAYYIIGLTRFPPTINIASFAITSLLPESETFTPFLEPNSLPRMSCRPTVHKP